MPLSMPFGTPPAFRPDVAPACSEQIEPSVPLGSDRAQRWVWHGRYGAMLIEVVDNEVFVNGQRVEPHAP
jgi:hypothetical protein